MSTASAANNSNNDNKSSSINNDDDTLCGSQPTNADTDDENRRDREICFGTMQSKIVGCRFYSGMAHAGEYVNLVREPNNKYDRNAIRVDNMAGHQVGHINKYYAAFLAPLLDQGIVSAEATIPCDATNVYELGADFALFGQPENTGKVQQALQQHKLRIAAPGQQGQGNGNGYGKGYGNSGSGNYASGSYGGYSVVAERRVSSSSSSKSQMDLDKLFEDMEKMVTSVALLDETTLPALKTGLYPHQRQGVGWMLARECDPDSASKGGLPSFWRRAKERGCDVFINDITHCSVATAPKSVKGGLLADDMGLGKSLSVVTCILANPLPGVVYDPANAAAMDVEGEAAGDGLDEMTAKELQEMAKTAGLSTSGKKVDLVARIRASRVPKPDANAAADTARGTLIVAPVS